MLSGIPDASSKITIMPSMLCTPAYASGFSSLHSLPSAPQYRVPLRRSRSTRSVNQFAGCKLVAVGSHQWALRAIVTHLVNSPHVTFRNWFSLLADTMTELPILVVSIHRISHDTSADFPTPRPDDTALRSASINSSLFCLPLLSLMNCVILRSARRCHARGALKCSRGVFFCPHGNTNNTNASGSSRSDGLQSCVMSICSSSGEYRGFCITQSLVSRQSPRPQSPELGLVPVPR